MRKQDELFEKLKEGTEMGDKHRKTVESVT